MTRIANQTVWTVALCLSVTAMAQAAPQIVNGSFEADTFTISPGYASQHGNSITGWTSDDYARVGLNPSGSSPFANDGAIPDGVNVAFIQNGADGTTGYLRANLSDLISGRRYRLSYRYNMRAGYASPLLRVTVNTTSPTVLQNDTLYPPVGGSNPYHMSAYTFTANATTHTVTFENTQATGDATLTLDDVRIEEATAAGWTTAAWSDDDSSGVDGSANYSHAINVGDQNAAVVNGITFKAAGYVIGPSEGVGGANYSTSLPNRYPSDDGNSITTGGSVTLANRFCYGPTPVDAANSITLSGLIPGMTYETTIFGVAWDSPPASRILGYSVNGSTEVTFNENVHGNNNGIRLSYRGTADANGQISVSGRIINNNQSFHTYAFANKAEPAASLILVDAFSGSNGADNMLNISTRAPDHANLVEAPAYIETGMNPSYQTDIQNGTARMGANAGAAIDIDALMHVKPSVMRIQADLKVGTLAGAVGANARGVGLGFYRNGTYTASQEVGTDFTGLVLAPDGSLYLYEDGGYSGATVAHSGGFDANTFYTLSYEIDVDAGTISNISLEGSTADYGPLESAANVFDDVRTELAGFTGSSSAGGTYGYVDNLVITEITPGSTTAGSLFKIK